MRVPTLQPARIIADQRPQVRQQAPDADAFGAGLGQGIEQASRTAFGIWRKEAQRANEARVLEADTLDAKHDLDAWTELQQVQGGGAPAAFNAAVESRQKRQGEIEKGLANDAQREAFRRAAANRLQGFENRGASHVVRETRRADDQAMAAAVSLAYDQAKANRDDTLALGNGFVDIREKWNAWADRQGLPPEERQRQQQALQDGYISSVITAHIESENDLAAKRFADQWGGHLSATAKEKIVGLLKTSSTKGEAMRLADTTFADGLDATAGRARIIEQAGDNPELRDMAIQRWEGHRRAQIQARDEDEGKAYAAAFALLEDPTKDYASLPAALVQRLEQRPDLKKRLMGFAQRQDRRVSGEDGTTELVRLQTLAYTDPEAFKKLDPNTLVGTMPKSDVVAMTEAIMEARQGKPGKQLKSIITKEQAITDAYLAAGIDPKDDDEDAAFFRKLLSDRLLAAGVSADDKDAPQRIEAEAKKMLVRVALDARNGKRPDTFEWKRAQTLLANLDEDDRSALMAEAGGNIDRAVRLLVERQRVEAQTPAAKAGPADSQPSRLLFGNSFGPR